MGEPETVIRAEGVGKKYVIRHNAPKQGMLRDALSDAARSLKRKLIRSTGPQANEEEFWALKDVSFEIKRGEVVGIIGRNGAGKSTLLKVLSRITEPTTGRIELDGRVASLLEVGTGFHPELTGRENIYMNGAILGMSRAEIKRKFDDIVAFAEVEKFLDTPVKRYSSGMYVRLAFAVAAHLEPEILIVDEVLAVGDAEFQKKCIGKMGDVAKGGRTVIFVSHNLSLVRQLCTTGVYLISGQVAHRGSASATVGEYVNRADPSFTRATPKGDQPAIESVRVDSDALLSGDLVVEVQFVAPYELAPVIGIVVNSVGGQPIFGTNRLTDPGNESPRATSRGTSVLVVHDVPLHSGTYRLSVWLGDGDGKNFEHLPDAVSFDFVSRRALPKGYSVDLIGPVQVAADWRIEVAAPTSAEPLVVNHS